MERHSHDTLRGLLALWVLAGHLLLTERYGTIYNAGFATHADFGPLGALAVLHFVAVDIFFMLSGLVLTLRYGAQFTQASTGKQIDRFYLHRVGRIWPLHALMVALIGWMAWAGIPHPISSGAEDVIFKHWEWSLALNLLLMNGWGVMPVASWNEPAWTLSVTFFLYLLFPNLVLLLKRVPAKTWLHALLIAALLIDYTIIRNWVELGSQSDGIGGMLRGLVFFTIGVLLGLMPTRPRVRFGLPLFIIAVLLWTYGSPYPLTLLHFTYPLLLLAVMPRVLPPRLSRWLGSRSFAIFITHYPVVLLVRHYLGDALAGWAAHGGVVKLGCYIFTIGLCLLAAEAATRGDALLRPRKTAP